MKSTPKKQIFIRQERLSESLVEKLQEAYPEGFIGHTEIVTRQNGEKIYAVRLETEEAKYLIQIDIPIDQMVEEEEEDDYADDPDYEETQKASIVYGMDEINEEEE